MPTLHVKQLFFTGFYSQVITNKVTKIYEKQDILPSKSNVSQIYNIVCKSYSRTHPNWLVSSIPLEVIHAEKGQWMPLKVTSNDGNPDRY